ncbi:MAG: isocitrate/isopropylmalate dehydrogenase family protein [Candidatus Woesearchaeota archaeon]
MYRICVLPGDGIGREVVPEAVRVLQGLPLDSEFVNAEAGYQYYQENGQLTPLPDLTLEKVRTADATLFGAVTTPPNVENYFSVIVKMRQMFELYANLRPSKTVPIKGCWKNVNLVIVRENTEGLYAGRERVEDNGNTAITERVITRKGSERIIRYAFDYAIKNKRKKVTLVHKGNVLRETDGLFRKVGLEVRTNYPNIEFEEMLVDAMAMRLIKDPESFDVIVTTNLFGDILSDEASQLVGGLGLAASGNIGDQTAIFEPVHGSAPDIAGKGIANPLAAILAAKMMLDYLGEKKYALRVEKAVNWVLKQRQVTPDLGGTLNTKQVTDAVLERL